MWRKMPPIGARTTWTMRSRAAALGAPSNADPPDPNDVEDMRDFAAPPRPEL
jgi:hypothetical protein